MKSQLILTASSIGIARVLAHGSGDRVAAADPGYVYQVVLSPDELTTAALTMAMFFFAAFVLSYHYASFYSKETYWKIAIETGAMIIFITWALRYSGGADSPLSDLYLL